MIKDWIKIRYGMSADFYVKVTVTQVFMDEVFREIVFPNAYMRDFTETINPNTGEGSFVITLLQKIDKVGDIVFQPFDEEFRKDEVNYEETLDSVKFMSTEAINEEQGEIAGDYYYIGSEDYYNNMKNNGTNNLLKGTLDHVNNFLIISANSNKIQNKTVPVILKYIAVKKGYKVNYNKEKNCIELYKGDKLEKEISGYYVHNGTAIVTTELFKLKFNNNWNERYHEIFDLYDSVEDAALATGCICYKLGLNFKFGVKKNNDKYAIDLVPSESSTLFKMNNNKIYMTDGKILYDMDKIFNAATTRDVRVEDPKNDYFFVSGIPDEVIGNFNGEKIKRRPKENWGVIGGGSYNKGVQKNSSGKYLIAVGPKILDPKYPDNGKIWNDDFKNFNKNIDVYLRHKTTNETKIIKCYVYDFKAHTYSKFPDNHPRNDEKITASINVVNGLMQTGIAYPNSSNAKQSLYCSKAHFDGSIIEFCGSSLDFKIKDYVLDKILVYKTK